jgi:hypothetical protein
VEEQSLKYMNTKERNWQKARLMGFNLHESVLTDAEKIIYRTIVELKNTLLEGWDSNTETLIGHPLPPFKCSWCGKRSNVPHNYRGHNYCFKHFKEHIESAT